MLLKFIKKKLIRLGNSSNVLKLWYLYHYIFQGKKLGNIGLDFSIKKTRFQVVQDIIDKKLNFPVNLLPASELDELKNEIKKLNIISTSILIKNFPRKSPEHIKVFRKKLVDHKNDILSKISK